MPDIPSLLARASELAPDLIRRLDKEGFCLMIDGLMWNFDKPEIEDRALILYAVLKECERRGWVGVMRLNPLQEHGYYDVGVGRNFPNMYDIGLRSASDPATAALSAFMAMLEQEHAFAAPDGGE